MKIGFIGLGLIGGSIAKRIKQVHPEYKIIAYSRTRTRLTLALSEHAIDEIADTIDARLGSCDLLFLCTPVSCNADYLRKLAPFVSDACLLTDVGSTKHSIYLEVEALGLTSHFIGGHPMAGSEKTGYENASAHLLENAFYILTPTKDSPPERLSQLQHLVEELGAIPMILDSAEHDNVVAAISHLPHLIACALVNLVRDSDTPAQTMKQVAAGGFKDITRIASSSPEMWEQICMTNRPAIEDFINRYIASLEDILEDIRTGNGSGIYHLFETAREYRDSISDRFSGSIAREYHLHCNIVDRSGAIAEVATLLASHSISIKNIGIVNNRNFDAGVLRIEFYDEDSRNHARQILEDQGFLAE